MILTYLAGIVALFFAMNIGASGAAASISVAYGSGAIESRKKALIIMWNCHIFRCCYWWK